MPNIEKLTTLANHLLHGKLGHEKFDFSNFNFTPHKMLISNECGTLGCALGECPIIWPDEWTFDGKHIVLMKEYLDYWDLDAPMIFFWFNYGTSRTSISSIIHI